jgi:hypothetical protein
VKQPLAVAVMLVALTTAAGRADGPRARIDAREAGAAGDGTRDDAPALQAALDRLAAAGGVLELSAGTYVIGAPLVVRGDGVALRGAGATLRAAATFAAGGGPAALLRNGAPREAGRAQRSLTVAGLELDGAGVAPGGVWLERVRDVRLVENTVRRLRAGGGAIVVRSTDDGESNAGEIAVADNVVELEQATTGIVLRKVVNCRVSGNRVQGTGAAGGHGLDLTLSQGCTVADNIVLTVDVGVLADETNHLQVIGNYVFAPRTGFRAARRPDGKRSADNNVFVNNRVLTGGTGFVVAGSGMMLVANYAAFLKPGPAIWVQRGGTHDVVVANNASVAAEGGIRFDASDGVVVANVPVANGTAGIEVNGQRVAVTSNALSGSPVGIRLGSTAAACAVVGNTVHGAREAPIAIAGRGHRVRDNSGPEAPLPEMGPGALYGTGEAEVRTARTRVEAGFADDRYVVSVEWAGDPGGREWIAEKLPAGFTIALPAEPRTPVRARWIARGF